MNHSYREVRHPSQRAVVAKNGAHLIAAICVGTFALLFSAGCRKEDMAEQERKNPQQPSSFFEDGNSARPAVEGTVARDGTPGDAYQYIRTSQSKTAPAAAAAAATAADGPLSNADFPADFPRDGEPLRRQIERGQQRFNIYCAICHGQTGAGDGMVVQRGFVRPPAFYPMESDRVKFPDLYRRSQNLLHVQPGYIVDKVTNGYGAMYSHAARVQPADRWAIAAYVQVLQWSQTAPKALLLPTDQDALNAALKSEATHE